MPDWLGEAFAAGADEDADIALMDLDDRGAPSGPTSLTGSGVTRMSISELGRIDSLGKTMSHGYVLRLRARGNDGQTYGAFCASYGGSYRTGYSYSPVSYSDLGMTNYQYNLHDWFGRYICCWSPICFCQVEDEKGGQILQSIEAILGGTKRFLREGEKGIGEQRVYS